MDVLNGHPKWAQDGQRGKNTYGLVSMNQILQWRRSTEKDQCLGDTFLPTIEIFALLTIFGGELRLSVLCHSHDFEIVFYRLLQTTRLWLLSFEGAKAFQWTKYTEYDKYYFRYFIYSKLHIKREWCFWTLVALFNIPKGEVTLSVSWHSHIGQIPSDSVHLMGAGFTHKGTMFDPRIKIHGLVTIAGRMEAFPISCNFALSRVVDIAKYLILRYG